MTFPPNIGPKAPQRNPPIVPQYFAPSVFFIDAIAQGVTTVVTTNVAHNYVVGQQVRLHIPNTYGMIQMNEKKAYVISIPSATQVIIDLDSNKYNAFIPSPAYGPTRPQICAIGDINTGVISSTGRVVTQTTIPGAFENTSPIKGTWLN